MNDMGGYLIIGITWFVGLVSVFLMLWAVNKIAPKRDKNKEPARNDTYECGEKTIGDAYGPFNVQYYFIVLLFAVFDVSIVMLIPWAFSFNNVNKNNVIFMTIFPLIYVIIILLGVFYAFKNKYFEWR